MDFTTLSDDELADIVRDMFDDLHRRVDLLPASSFKTGVRRRLEVAHRGMDLLKEHLVNGGVIRPLSGGEDKPPQEP